MMAPVHMHLFAACPSQSPANVFPNHRLTCSASSSSSLSPPHDRFAVDDFLAHALHLSKPQAQKISKHLPHAKSPSAAISVISFLTDLGLSSSDIAAAASSEPMILCISVDDAIIPKIEALEELGFTQSQAARLIVLAPGPFRRRGVIRKVAYWLDIFGSVETLLKALKKNHYLLTSSLERVVDPNVQLLRRQCGLTTRQIAKMVVTSPRLLTTNHEIVKDTVARAEEMDVPRSSPMFQYALAVASCLSREVAAAKMAALEAALGIPGAEVRVLIRRHPMILSSSKERLQRVCGFLMGEVGMEGRFVASNPALFTYSVDRRMAPRYGVMRELRQRNLLPVREQMICNAMKYTERKFLERFVEPYRESVPELADAYAAACAAGKERAAGVERIVQEDAMEAEEIHDDVQEDDAIEELKVETVVC